MATRSLRQALLPFLLLVVFIPRNTFCYLDDIQSHLGTKSPYRFVQNDDPSVGKYPGCTPLKIWTMNRHGTRYPGADVISSMQNTLPSMRDDILHNHKQNKGHLNTTQLTEFEKWTPIDILPKDEKILASEGQDEMHELAVRMQMRFPEAIPREYDENKFIFRYTPSERTFESAKYFATGLFKKEEISNVNFVQTAKNDSVLRFYKYCNRWIKDVKKNKATLKELVAYLTGQREVVAALDSIANILGYNKAVSINQTKLLYQTCAFETALKKKFSSPWCFSFKPSSIEVLEYAADLKYYWIDGYGYDLTQRLACNVLRDVINFFSDHQKATAAFHFTHSGTVLKTLVHFGLFKPNKPLDHIRDPNRPWRVSYIDAFGSNLAFILYRCDDNVNKVLVLHQERPVRLPECPDSDLCPLDNIIRSRSKTLDGCDLKKMCELTSRDEL